MSHVSPDFALQNEGTIYLLSPHIPAARSWVEENIGQDDGYQPFWPTIVVEHRYIAQILDGIRLDGLLVAEADTHETQ